MIKFIDLFCGIGGFRLALSSLGMNCIFSAEINPHACAMYEANFNENPHCDITKLNPQDIPDFDILCAGFPCQAFSIAGKKLGFNESRGTLFFDICRIVKEKSPKVILLENVKNLLVHDSGNTFRVIEESLINLGYQVSYQVLNANDYGLAQSRERVIIVAVNNGFAIRNRFAVNDELNNKIICSLNHDGQEVKKFDFTSLKKSSRVKIESILEPQIKNYLPSDAYTLVERPKLQKSGLIFSGYLNKNIRVAGVRPDTLHLSRVHKQNNRIYCASGVHPTLSSQETSGRYYISLKDGKNDIKVRKMTLLECFRLMGFPDDFKKPGSQCNLYQRVGNSVCVNMIREVARNIERQFF